MSAGAILWLISLGILCFATYEVGKKTKRQKQLITWLEQREKIFASIIRDMVALRGSNFIHELPGEWDVNFVTLRAMWKQVEEAEWARLALFTEFNRNFQTLEDFERNNPIPPAYVPRLLQSYRWLKRALSRH